MRPNICELRPKMAKKRAKKAKKTAKKAKKRAKMANRRPIKRYIVKTQWKNTKCVSMHAAGQNQLRKILLPTNSQYFAQLVSRWVQDGAKMGQDGPKMAEDGPRWPSIASR